MWRRVSSQLQTLVLAPSWRSIACRSNGGRFIRNPSFLASLSSPFSTSASGNKTPQSLFLCILSFRSHICVLGMSPDVGIRIPRANKSVNIDRIGVTYRLVYCPYWGERGNSRARFGSSWSVSVFCIGISVMEVLNLSVKPVFCIGLLRTNEQNRCFKGCACD